MTNQKEGFDLGCADEQEGQQFMMGYNPKMEGWGGDRYAPMPHGKDPVKAAMCFPVHFLPVL